MRTTTTAIDTGTPDHDGHNDTDNNYNNNSTTADPHQYDADKKTKRLRLVALLKQAAAAAVEKGDPWAKHEMPVRVPAERVVRHFYHYSTQSWTSEETIVKMERQPFTHGAMRFCYRLKKRSALPESATNHRFHQHGWTRACNYVAKTYHTKTTANGGDDQEEEEEDSTCSIDTSEQAKEAVRNDVSLQYEAAHWAERFNAKNPPKQIIFIRAYALEFPDRPGQPW
jgi:elongation factor 2 kinase